MSDPTPRGLTFSHDQDVTAALADPALVPPPATPGPYGTVAWLRATVARFSAGEPHARRRALVLADLDRLDLVKLRILAAGGYQPDVRLRVVRVLATMLGLADPAAVARDVKAVARAYFEPAPAESALDGPAPGDPEADAAVARLLPAMGDEDAETAANRIGLLVQACDATATLVEHARRHPDGLAGALRDDPPVRVMRRFAARATVVGGVAVPAGAHVLLDLDAARGPDREPPAFGAPPRLCPGRAQAMVIAEGILYGSSDPSDTSVPPAETHLDQAGLAALIPETIAHVLALADTWTDWDGRPVVNADDRTYTPHKVVRRVADHLLDHLAEVEARLAGEPAAADHWHASNVTTPADLVPFTAADLDETRSRLTRLGRIWAQRVAALPEWQLDDSPGAGWSFRQIVCHLARTAAYYADSVGPTTSKDSVGPATSKDSVGPATSKEQPR
ncbi:hypothetical protein [Streptomyces sp. CBMA123]|uniref:hypothetical protein n=1 Tax=Streptomyces sp. CBMA123 TaxID=1896313 RepID=UPI001CB80D08|nr:hypothetical protein [Streptomyces sp. CBMA123]MBD0690987.1 hypothetical protein [Streptomyces sp. CBMA123]